MQAKLKTYGTTFTVGLFLVSAVSGVALFFHIGSATFHSMHEWLSMLLLVPVVLHVWKNWPSFKCYFKRKTIAVPLAVSLAGAVAFAVPSLIGSSSGGNPTRAAFDALQGGTIAQVAPLYKLTPEALAGRLKAKGYRVESMDDTLMAVAKASGKELGPRLIADVSFGN